MSSQTFVVMENRPPIDRCNLCGSWRWEGQCTVQDETHGEANLRAAWEEVMA